MTIVVPRHEGFQVPGWGLLKGLWVTARHFVRTYLTQRNRHVPGKELFEGGRYGLFVIQYPEERYRLPDRYRGLPILLFDGETGAELCTACGACVRACPLGIIHLEQAVNEDGKKLPYALSFSIEYGACMNCGLCADSCNFGSIVMDHRLETAQSRREDLWLNKEDLLRPVSYYFGIAPSVWAEIEEDAMKRLEGTMKRRPEGAGIVSRS